MWASCGRRRDVLADQRLRERHSRRCRAAVAAAMTRGRMSRRCRTTATIRHAPPSSTRHSRVPVRRKDVARQIDRRGQHRVDIRRSENRRRCDGEPHQPTLQVLQLRFDPLPIRNVPGDLRRPDDRAVRVADRRDGQRHVHRRAVLAPAHGVEVLDALAAADARRGPCPLRSGDPAESGCVMDRPTASSAV